MSELKKGIINLIAKNLEEGDNYFALEEIKGVTYLCMSCWDDISEEIDNKLVFRSLEDGLAYCIATSKYNLRVADFLFSYDVKLKPIKL